MQTLSKQRREELRTMFLFLIPLMLLFLFMLIACICMIVLCIRFKRWYEFLIAIIVLGQAFVSLVLLKRGFDIYVDTRRSYEARDLVKANLLDLVEWMVSEPRFGSNVEAREARAEARRWLEEHADKLAEPFENTLDELNAILNLMEKMDSTGEYYECFTRFADEMLSRPSRCRRLDAEYRLEMSGLAEGLKTE